MNFRERIKKICKAQGITQKELAKRMGITSIGLNQILRGEYPQLQSLEKIANALDVSISDFFQNDSNTIICPICGTVFEMKYKNK